MTPPLVSPREADEFLRDWALFDASMPVPARVKRFRRLSCMQFGPDVDRVRRLQMYTELCSRERMFAVDLDDLGLVATHPFTVRLIASPPAAASPIGYHERPRLWLRDYIAELIRVGLVR